MTAKIANYILNSEFATLKNDSNTETIVLSLPATTLISGTPADFSTTYTAGVSGAPMDFDINYSMTTQRFITSYMQVIENADNANIYSVIIAIFRSGANTIKVKCSLFYGGISPSITSNARTITVSIRTFIPPF